MPTSNGSGHLIFVNKGALFAVPFDLDDLAVRGTPALVLEGVGESPIGSAQLDFSRSGTLVYGGGGRTGLFTMQWLDGTGKRSRC